MSGKAKRTLFVAGISLAMIFGLEAADYNQTENFGVKKPGDRVGFTVTPPGTVISGNCTNSGGFVWTGGPASWNGTIPDDFSGNHAGAFDGTYQPTGTGGQPKIYTWYVDTNAKVVKVGKIEINAEGSQHDVTGQEITLLKGTKYTFKAIPDPSNLAFPSGEPKWSGIESGSGETIEVTFDTEGSFSLTAKCGSETGKKVDLVVILPEIEEVRYKGQDIVDKQDKWTKSGINDPACFVQNRNSSVEVVFKHARSLTYNTSVVIYGDVSWWDDDMTGGNYSETTTTFKNWPSTPLIIQSESTNEPEVDYYEEVDITWQYKVPSGINSMIDAGDTNSLDYYLIWNDQVAGSEFKFDIIKWACDAAEDTAGEDDIREELNDEIYSEYDYDYNCHMLSSNFTWCNRVLGISANTWYWSSCSSMYYIKPGFPNIGDMAAMQSISFVPAGHFWSQIYDWSFHQWAQSGGKQYDPSSGNIHNGSWGGYEDYVMAKYHRVDSLSPTVVVLDDNQPGQTLGCESTGQAFNAAVFAWSSP
jgi:plastocyanin